MAVPKLNCRNQASAQRLNQALPLQPTCKSLFIAQRQSPAVGHQHFSIHSRQVPCAKVAAPSRKATQTPPISHRFVSTKCIYCYGSKNLKRDKTGVQVPIPGDATSVSLFAGGQRAAAEPATTPQAAAETRGDAALQTMPGPPVLKEITGMTEP